MGSSASKATRAASAARKYPTTPPTTRPPTTNAPAAPRPPPAQNHQPGPTVHPQARARNTRDEAINLDASDPDFAASLRSLGPVQPNPTLSPSSTFSTPSASRPRAPDPRKNPAIAVLDARARLQNEAEVEFQQAGRRGFEGRQFVDVFVIRDALVKRDRGGWAAERIEKALGLRRGVVGRLGVKGMVEVATEQGRADREVHMV
ncbi:hypothetical protein EJ03DRAFT_271243 [Teratosphaeria nubilosa]|uniref:Helix-turn-helix domain-containing protein n=1 Tax=Teratosphaeria nubilosa TaxID=161662 RepID=A0A6G1LAZ6_9PEZI|nr:hypothetical protein EJ03DRAFT_271243 [Teratosphaeria nubilosa]